MAFIFAVHIPIAGLSMLPVFFSSWPLLLLPVHIVFLELVIDPSCTLIFEAEAAESDVMQRPPRDSQERLFSMKTLGLSLLQGGTAFAACLAVYLLARPGRGDDAARALTFTTLVVSFLAIILANRSWTLSIFGSLRNPNAALWWAWMKRCIAPSVCENASAMASNTMHHRVHRGVSWRRQSALRGDFTARKSSKGIAPFMQRR